MVAFDAGGGDAGADGRRSHDADRLQAAADARTLGEDLEVRPAIYVPLDIKMTLCAQQAYWPEDLRAALEEEFSDSWTRDGRPGFFNPDVWTFGQPLYASQLIGRALKAGVAMALLGVIVLAGT